MDEFYNKHYIITDASGRITDGWSDGPHPDRDTTNAVCINDQGGYQFRLFPGGEENPALYSMDGIPLYEWDGSQALQRAQEKIEADRAELPKPEPSDLTARIEALEEITSAIERGIST